MSEERWHNFAKEKPSEDMEGRNFIVSNGHYEKIATWCGYWENEPFMGDHLLDEVVRWKFYFTPEEEKANEATRTEPKPMKCDELKEYKAYEYGTSYVYDIGEVNEAIAELKAKLEDVQASHYAEMVDAWKRERRLKRALWLARANSARNSYLKWNLFANFESEDNLFTIDEFDESPGVTDFSTLRTYEEWYKVWQNVERKCRVKAEEYK